MLLTLLLSSASPLAVPSAAQSQNHHRKSVVVSSSSSGSFLAGQQMQQQQQHGGGQRRTESVLPSWPDTPPDLYNITLSAMKQYIRSQLNSTRFAKGPRKRSHHHFSDADLDFYQKLKEFNNTQQSGFIAQPVLGFSSNKSSPPNSVREPVGVELPLKEEERMVPCGIVPEQSRAAAVDAGIVDAVGGSGQKEENVLMDDPREYIPRVSPAGGVYQHRPVAKTTSWDAAFVRHKGYVYFLLSFSLIGIVVLGLFGAYRCLRVATVIGRGTGTQASEALATLPIQFITSDDLAAAVAAAAGASINADSNHLPVPMLSVQSPGCAGMERLGVPARSSIGSPPLRDERNRRLRVDSGTSGAASANSNSSTIYQHHPNVHSHHSHHSAVGNSSSTSSNFMSIHNHHAQFHQATTTTSRTTAQKDTGSSGGGSSSNSYLKAASTGSSSTSSSFYGTINNNSNNLCSASTISRCPHHVALPDGERGPDRDLQIRSSSQQSEIPRTYVKAPPNKTVRDVPVQHQHHHPSSSVGGIGSSVSSSASSSMNNLTSQHARFGGSGSGISLGNRALVNSMSTIGSSQAAAAAAKSDKQKKTILWFLAGNKTSKTSTAATTATSSSSGISVNSSSHNNNNIGPNSSGGAASCNNNTISYQTRSNPTASSSALAAASMSGSRSGLSSSSHLAVSGIHSHNHHYRQSTASTVQQRHQPTSSIPSSASGSSTGSSSTSTPMSVSASPSPDTSTHYM
ncbi:mucin-19 [Culex pipiens pallens]|uniref:mucin-19 n=1 Tax=Culex pipiens pallens TaxID=42434 RepID=UPI0022AAF473|nr:mucin-19 [Culex pipiens pallens]